MSYKAYSVLLPIHFVLLVEYLQWDDFCIILSHKVTIILTAPIPWFWA
jgi:hypothetical protein